MTTFEYEGHTWNLPPRGRFGCAIAWTLHRIIRAARNGERIALYAAMDIRGSARNYEGRYRNAFVRFARENPRLLREGAVGPASGYGFEFVGEKPKPEPPSFTLDPSACPEWARPDAR